jgi:hypothetical protein
MFQTNKKSDVLSAALGSLPAPSKWDNLQMWQVVLQKSSIEAITHVGEE